MLEGNKAWEKLQKKFTISKTDRKSYNNGTNSNGLEIIKTRQITWVQKRNCGQPLFKKCNKQRIYVFAEFNFTV